MKNIIILFAIILLPSRVLIAQNVGIGTNTPHDKAILELSSNSKGLLIPRLTETEKLNIQNPPVGLLVYVTTDNEFYYFDGTEWSKINAGSIVGWNTAGNKNTGGKILGSIDNSPVHLFTNNTPRLSILPNGNMGINITSPESSFHMVNNLSAPFTLNLEQNSNSALSANFVFNKSRGTHSSRLPIQSGDQTGMISFGGFEGTDFFTGSYILGKSVNNFTNTNASSDLQFVIQNKINSTTDSFPLTLSHLGRAGIGTFNPAYLLDIRTKNDNETGILNIANATQTNFLRLSSGSVGNPNPAILWKNQTSLRLATDESGYKEMMRIESTGTVGIGTMSPDSSSILDLTSTNKGFLPPRMDSSQRNAILSPAEGLTIYNTSIKGYEYFDGTAWCRTRHFVGEHYGGGIVFFVYDHGQHGLICATTVLDRVDWDPALGEHTGATGDGLRAGERNTTLIIDSQSSDEKTGSFAAKQCADYSFTMQGVTYGGWYLPSKYELNLLYLNKAVNPAIGSEVIWSSTEVNSLNAWVQGFSSGFSAFANKETNNGFVVPIRAF